MRWGELEREACSVARTVSVIGDRWTLLILRESFYGSTRFEQFHSVLNCPRNLLSERLSKLGFENLKDDEEAIERLISAYEEQGKVTSQVQSAIEELRAQAQPDSALTWPMLSSNSSRPRVSR